MYFLKKKEENRMKRRSMTLAVLAVSCCTIMAQAVSASDVTGSSVTSSGGTSIEDLKATAESLSKKVEQLQQELDVYKGLLDNFYSENGTSGQSLDQAVAESTLKGTEVLLNEIIHLGETDLIVKNVFESPEVKAFNAADDSMTVKAKNGGDYLQINLDLSRSGNDSYTPSDIIKSAALLVGGVSYPSDAIYCMTYGRDGSNPMGFDYHDYYLVKIASAQPAWSGMDLLAVFTLTDDIKNAADPVYFQFNAGGKDYYTEIDMSTVGEN